jgi:hypothetical protein
LTGIDPIYHHFNIKKKMSTLVVLEVKLLLPIMQVVFKFVISAFVFYVIIFFLWFFLSFDLPSRLGNIKTIPTIFNWKLEIGKDPSKDFLSLNHCTGFNDNIKEFFTMQHSRKHSFETRLGPTGQLGTRPTRSWNRAGLKKK